MDCRDSPWEGEIIEHLLIPQVEHDVKPIPAGRIQGKFQLSCGSQLSCEQYKYLATFEYLAMTWWA